MKHAAAMIGPNALTQTAAALRALEGEDAALLVFTHAGLVRRLCVPPATMVPAREAAALMASLAECLAPASALAVAVESGRRTADYLLAHRIPRAAQRLLRAAPRPLAAWALGRAVVAHAWTFAGAAGVRVGLRRGGVLIDVDDEPDPLTRAWRSAVFERLFRILVAAGATAGTDGNSHAIALAEPARRPPAPPQAVPADATRAPVSRTSAL